MARIAALEQQLRPMTPVQESPEKESPALDWQRRWARTFGLMPYRPETIRTSDVDLARVAHIELLRDLGRDETDVEAVVRGMVLSDYVGLIRGLDVDKICGARGVPTQPSLASRAYISSDGEQSEVSRPDPVLWEEFPGHLHVERANLSLPANTIAVRWTGPDPEDFQRPRGRYVGVKQQETFAHHLGFLAHPDDPWPVNLVEVQVLRSEDRVPVRAYGTSLKAALAALAAVVGPRAKP